MIIQRQFELDLFFYSPIDIRKCLDFKKVEKGQLQSYLWEKVAFVVLS